MSDRRSFIKQSAQLAIGGLAMRNSLPAFLKLKSQYEPGVQLFTLMSVIDQDTLGTLQQVAGLGYVNIESAFSRQGGYYGKTAAEFASMLKDLGLNWKAHHVSGAPFRPRGGNPPASSQNSPSRMPVMKNLKENMQEIVDDLASGGIEYLVCASIPIGTPEEVAEAVITLNQTGELCKKAGLKFTYHNHDREFAQVGDSTPYEVFLSQVSSDLMKMELDLAWVTKAGVDPVSVFERNPGRFPLWHVKDIDTDMLTLKPVGQGSIDFARIFANAGKAGLIYPFVEHDRPDDAIASLRASIDYLKENIFK